MDAPPDSEDCSHPGRNQRACNPKTALVFGRFCAKTFHLMGLGLLHTLVDVAWQSFPADRG